MARQQEQYEPFPHASAMTFGTGLNIFLILMGGYCACFWPFMRHSFGVRAFGIQGLAAIAVMYLWGLFYPCPEEMVAFFCVWFCFLFYHRMEALQRGQERHSREDGIPWMANLLRPADQFVAKTAFEGAILLLVGSVLYGTVSEGLGTFIALGGIPLTIKKCVEKAIDDVELRQWRDTQVEMRYRAERFKNRPR